MWVQAKSSDWPHLVVILDQDRPIISTDDSLNVSHMLVLGSVINKSPKFIRATLGLPV
jgi:hypothetical protein